MSVSNRNSLWLAVLGLILAFSVPDSASASGPRGPKPTLSQRLGYSANDKVLLIHIDDIGSFSSANRAAKDAFSGGLARSGSIMFPAPAAREAVQMLGGSHDLGVHVTLSTDFTAAPCIPSAGVDAVSSLVSWDGTFTEMLPSLVFARTQDVSTEIEAQIQSAIGMGLRPSHIDTHVGVVFFKPSWLNTYVNLARKYRIPPMVPRWNEGTSRMVGGWGWMLSFVVNPMLKKVEDAGFLLIDDLYILPPPEFAVTYEERKREYIDILKGLKPGVSQLIVHPAYADQDFQRDAIDWNEREIFRAHEARLLHDPEIKALIQSEGIQLTNWKAISDVYPWDEVSDVR